MTLLQIEADSLPFLKQVLEARGYVQRSKGWVRLAALDPEAFVLSLELYRDWVVPQWSGSGWVVKIKC